MAGRAANRPPWPRRPRFLPNERATLTDFAFYHLQRQPLEAALPRLLEKSVERGWRALVKVASEERLGFLDDRLWAYSDESFLPHGSDRDPDPAEHPIFLTQGDANPNGASVLFVLENAALPGDLSAYGRVAIMFDGADEPAVAAARGNWKNLKAAGHEVSYWQEDEGGRWSKRA